MTHLNPFIYLDALTTGTQCTHDDVGLDKLAKDLKQEKTTPNFSYIAPDACDDGSDTPCTTGAPAGLTESDTFLKTVIPEIKASPAYKHDGMIIVTFDQAPQTGPDADSSSCCDQPAFPNLSGAPPPTTTGTATTGTTGTTTTETTPPATPTAPATTPTDTTTAPATTPTDTTTAPATTPTDTTTTTVAATAPVTGATPPPATTTQTTTTDTTTTTSTTTTGTPPGAARSARRHLPLRQGRLRGRRGHLQSLLAAEDDRGSVQHPQAGLLQGHIPPGIRHGGVQQLHRRLIPQEPGAGRAP